MWNISQCIRPKLHDVSLTGATLASQMQNWFVFIVIFLLDVLPTMDKKTSLSYYLTQKKIINTVHKRISAKVNPTISNGIWTYLRANSKKIIFKLIARYHHWHNKNGLVQKQSIAQKYVLYLIQRCWSIFMNLTRTYYIYLDIYLGLLSVVWGQVRLDNKMKKNSGTTISQVNSFENQYFKYWLFSWARTITCRKYIRGGAGNYQPERNQSYYDSTWWKF